MTKAQVQKDLDILKKAVALLDKFIGDGDDISGDITQARALLKWAHTDLVWITRNIS